MIFRPSIRFVFLIACVFYSDFAFSQPIDKEIIDLAYQGDAWAKYTIGRAVYHNELDFPNKALAKNWLYDAIQEEPIFAWYMALSNQNNPQENEKWLRLGTKLNDPNSITSLASLYLQKQTQETDQIAFKLLKKAYELDFESSFASLGTLYLEGTGTKANEKRAKELFYEAIDAGVPDGHIQMGHFYRFHQKPNDLNKAISNYIMASQKGDVTGPIYIMKTYIQNPDQGLLSRKDAVFWAIVSEKIGINFKPTSREIVIADISDAELKMIRQKAEAFFKKFHT